MSTKYFDRTKVFVLIRTITGSLTCVFLLIDHVTAQTDQLTQPGSFVVGCNYWASHAGTHTWSNWKPEVVEKDFKQLSANGIKILRVFPLWPDFQPIYQIYAAAGTKKYIAFKDGKPLPMTGFQSDGVSEEQLAHFELLADLAQKYNLKLIVGLVTGWMSGQLYVPPALEGRNILTDPESLMWQQKFVNSFVRRLKNKPAIIAWDFGNECNVMQNLDNHYQAYVWSSLLFGTIKTADPTRPVISGMHGLKADPLTAWNINDQAANTDILTTHPYSLWTPYASQDAINTIRTILHGAAETRLYADIGNKPALVEETGVMGPMTGGEREKAAFARAVLFSNWANDCKGTLWWCAYDQANLEFPPYNYSSVENELGLIKQDRSVKPVLNEFKNFSTFLQTLPFKNLPPRKTEAVCILTEGQDNWSVAYSSFILAKQAGFDFQFQMAGQEIKDAPLYLLPSLKGISPVYKDYWQKLLEKVRSGSTLYVSLDDAYLPSFNDPLGIEVLTNVKRKGGLQFHSLFQGDSLTFYTLSERKLTINPAQEKVLAVEDDGTPVFLESTYGKGKIYLLTFPLEDNLTHSVGAFGEGQPRYADIYKQFAKVLINERALSQNNPSVAVTEHAISEKEKVIILINYNPKTATIDYTLQQGWEINKILYGKVLNQDKQMTINGNDAIVLLIKFKGYA